MKKQHEFNNNSNPVNQDMLQYRVLSYSKVSCTLEDTLMIVEKDTSI